MNQPAPIIQATHLDKFYGDFHALKDIDLTIEVGEIVAIVGASGSGKTTLMNILGCLDRPTSGTYRVSGREAARLGPNELAALRREHFGFIFQRYHLLAELSALGNVEIPATYAGSNPVDRQHRASRMLARLGMADRIHHRPNQLSGGQQQRVSIARALINNAEVILADEPTGNVDPEMARRLLQLFGALNRLGTTVIVATHDVHLLREVEGAELMRIEKGQLSDPTGAFRNPPRPLILNNEAPR